MENNLQVTITQGSNKIILDAQAVISLFHQLYYESRVWEKTMFFGYPILKCPLDLWVYQEIIAEVKPDILIETGTFHGASALFMAYACDIMCKGQIVTIDILERNPRPTHPRIQYLVGSSVDAKTISQVQEMVRNRKVMVILDSDHSYEHVYNELNTYAEMVSQGSYLIVEDTNVNGHPVRPDFGPGPMEAVEQFLAENEDFVVDLSREKFFMTQNPKGFLKKVKA